MPLQGGNQGFNSSRGGGRGGGRGGFGGGRGKWVGRDVKVIAGSYKGSEGVVASFNGRSLQ